MLPATVTPALPAPSAERLIDSFLSGLGPNTLRAYRQSLEDFRAYLASRPYDESGAPYLGSGGLAEAVRCLIAGGHGRANALALAYRAHMVEHDHSAATVNARLAALRSVVRLARILGLVTWELEVRNVRAAAYRDTRGPGSDWFREAVAHLKKQGTPKAKRDLAILRLIYDLALRRGSVASLDLEHVDLQERCVWVKVKGEPERVRRTLPRPTLHHLQSWIEVRGTGPGPLFHGLDRGQQGTRLSATSIYREIRKLGARTGKPNARPHGLRHSSITEAARRTGGDVPKIMAFSGHKHPQTVMIYVDNLRDAAGEVAALVAGEDEGVQ